MRHHQQGNNGFGHAQAKPHAVPFGTFRSATDFIDTSPPWYNTLCGATIPLTQGQRYNLQIEHPVEVENLAISNQYNNWGTLLHFANQNELATSEQLEHFLAAPLHSHQQVKEGEKLCQILLTYLAERLFQTQRSIIGQYGAIGYPIEPEYLEYSSHTWSPQIALSQVNNTFSLVIQKDPWLSIVDVNIINLPTPIRHLFYRYIYTLCYIGEKAESSYCYEAGWFINEFGDEFSILSDTELTHLYELASKGKDDAFYQKLTEHFSQETTEIFFQHCDEATNAAEHIKGYQIFREYIPLM